MIRKVLLSLLFTILTAWALSAQEVKRVAILETVDKEDKVAYGVEFQLRAFITDAVSNTPGFEGYDRVDMAQINKEHNFQRTGMVSDADIKKLGEMTGASSIVVAEAASYGSDDRIIIAAKIINIETGRIENTAKPKVASTSDDSMEKACGEVVSELLGGARRSGTAQLSPSGHADSSVGQDLTETAYGLNLRMVYVEGGTFTMGSTSEQGGEAYSDESPIRQVTVGPFYMGMLEVTQGQWEKVMGTGISQQRNKADPRWTLSGVGPDYPMYYVSWEEAKEFCLRLSRQTGKTYRLPTEAEWEYAARGGRKNEGTKYSGGWNLDDVGWYTGNSGSSTHVCGTKRSNALGLYDMSGNVWEWCEDWYGPYLSYDTDNPRGASQGSDRVARGGSWYNDARFCRVSYRGSYTPSYRSHFLGFRVVLVP